MPGIFTVTRTGPTTDPLTLTYAVTGTATPGADYNVLSGTVTIPIGAASATITVTPVDDTEYEYDETVIVTLAPVPDFVVSPVSATVTIVSDELPPDLVVAKPGHGRRGCLHHHVLPLHQQHRARHR